MLGPIFFPSSNLANREDKQKKNERKAFSNKINNSIYRMYKLLAQCILRIRKNVYILTHIIQNTYVSEEIRMCVYEKKKKCYENVRKKKLLSEICL